ncbi:aminotransferase class I/II-fold pyridoxal phosphate-dependent enzyme [Athalassotoga saccharophila]|uniref:aminotransferase class I/II-fold pyridoxal phosphate-dependent enzyme n=1 Tax=Athalassotoga saccharophila TaxID=1441386 RepID=UPI00137A26E7|nr:aminotransferase class I/II-fold pyridoxal phosphate-dependent enzyme [Athalassotoga saccharophila]BBJ27993.1 threonine-phosphate decarboxylase [Athalassotoga saccharophila]
MEKHGGTMNENSIDFSISVNPYTPKWKEALFKRCEEISNRYTYIEWIEERFRQKFGWDTVVTAGATEAFSIIGRMIQGRKVIIPCPSYGEYERVSGMDIVKIPPRDSRIDLDSTFEIAMALSKVHRTVIFLGNPNNPTGEYFRVEKDVESLADKGILFVLDEAFIDFVEEEKRWKIDHPNVIIVRTFTKSYGMPGIRVGYVKNKNMMSFFESNRLPWAIGSCGYAFIEFLLKDDERFLKESIKMIRQEAVRFKEIGIQTDANFGMLKVGNANEAQKILDGIGIHVRNCESFGLPEWIRVAVRKKEENDRLFDAIKRVIK